MRTSRYVFRRGDDVLHYARRWSPLSVAPEEFWPGEPADHTLAHPNSTQPHEAGARHG